MTQHRIVNQEYVGDEKQIEATMNLGDLRVWIDQMQAEGATHFRWRSYYDEDLELQAYKPVYETDEQLKKRLEREQKFKEHLERTSLKKRKLRYEELKKEFEPETDRLGSVDFSYKAHKEQEGGNQ